MKQHFRSMKEDLQEEKKFYSEELDRKDWEYLKNSSELFLIHAYLHLFKTSIPGFEVFGGDEYNIKYGQFYLNLAVGLELLLKSILLKKGEKINRMLKDDPNNSLDPERTIPFGTIIDRRLKKVFLGLDEVSFEEIKDTLRLINLRRNNIAHCSKRSHDTYAHEFRFSYITLYIYDNFFYGENQELTGLLLKSIDRGKSKIGQSMDFKPLKIVPRSLRMEGSA